MNNLPNVSRETAYEMCLKLDAISIVYQNIFPDEYFKQIRELVIKAQIELLVLPVAKLPNLTEQAKKLKPLLEVPTLARYDYDLPENLV